MKFGRLRSRVAGLAVSAAMACALVAYGCSDSSDAPTAAGQDAAPTQDGATADGSTLDAAPANDAATDATPDVEDSEDQPAAIAQLQWYEDGGALGVAAFYNADGGGVTVNVTIIGAAPDGEHGITIHQNGDCGGNGANAGAHWDVGSNQHALPSESAARHLGDLGNITITDGFGTLTLTDPRWTTEADAGDGGTSVVGHSIILKANPDQGASVQPTGNSGTRVSCGVIEVADW